MGIEERVRGLVERSLSDLVQRGVLPSEATRASFSIERPKRAEHGDLATNAALVLQKLAKRPPREIAGLLAERLKEDAHTIRDVEIAGPGFLNLRLTEAPYHAVLGEVLSAGAGYGRAPAATGERVLVEFVSANPTGPLLVSHARGAVLGDAVASLLEAAGHRVVREYYVNDFGNQVRLLGESVRAALEGREGPEDGYKGAYVAEIAEHIRARSPNVASDPDRYTLARVAVTLVLDGIAGSKTLPGIKRTLGGLGVHHDVWTSEEGIHRWGRVAVALDLLRQRSSLEERDGALFFKSEAEGDDKDRVIQKTDGTYTYFASDIAYHADKLARGFDRLIDVWGADHHGYVARVRGALSALGLPADRFEVLLFQLVTILRDGKPVRMGKRLGNGITIEEVVEEIDEAAQRQGAGADAIRYFYLSRRSDTTVELDLEIAKKSSLDNPVFYLQYGYARACSILRRASEVFDARPDPSLVHRLTHPDEIALLGQLGRFPAMVAEAAVLREPHRVIFFLQELSQGFQSYFTRLKDDPVLPQKKHTAEEGYQDRWDWDKTRARLAWVDAIRTVYGAALRLAGITALERMGKLEAAKDISAETEEESA